MAFHPYPRVVPSVFNRSGFGPPQGLTPASPCPWIAHPASRPRHATARPVKTRSRCGSVSLNLAACRDSQAHSTKGTPSHRRRCSDCLWAHGFRRCFTPLSGCFSPFPRGTGSLSVIGECSALEGGPPCFSPGFTCPDLLGEAVLQALPFRVRGSHPVPPAFPGRSATTKLSDCSPGIGPWDVAPRDPRAATPLRLSACTGLGWPGFARRYSRDLG